MIELLPNITTVVQWFIFMAVLLALNLLVYKPTLAIISERKKKTTGLSEDAHHLLDQAKKSLETYQAQMTEAKVLATRAREHLVKEGREEEHTVVGRARRENEEVLEDLRRNLDQESKEATFKLKQYAQDLARMIVSRVMERDHAA